MHSWLLAFLLESTFNIMLGATASAAASLGTFLALHGLLGVLTATATGALGFAVTTYVVVRNYRSWSRGA